MNLTKMCNSYSPLWNCVKTLAIFLLFILSTVSSDALLPQPPAISKLLFAASQFSNSSLFLTETAVGSRLTNWRRPEPLSRSHEYGIIALSYLNGWSGDNLMTECYGLAHVWLRPSEPIPGLLPIPEEERNTPFWSMSEKTDNDEKKNIINAGIRSVDIVSRTAMSVGLSRDLVKLQEAWQKTYKSLKLVYHTKKKLTNRLLIDLIKASEASNIASSPKRIDEIIELSKNSTSNNSSNSSGLNGPAAAHLLGLSVPLAKSLSSIYSLTGHIAHVTETALSDKDDLESIASAIFLRLNMSIGMCLDRWEKRRTGDMIVDPSDPTGMDDHAELVMLSPDGQAQEVVVLDMDKDARSVIENDPMGRVKEQPFPPRPSGAKLDLNPAVALNYLKDVVIASEDMMSDALGAMHVTENEKINDNIGVIEAVCLLRFALNQSLPSLSTLKSTMSSAANADITSADTTCKRLLYERSKKSLENQKCFPRITVSGTQADCARRFSKQQSSILDSLPEMISNWMSSYGKMSTCRSTLSSQNATCFEKEFVDILVNSTLDTLNKVRDDDESSVGEGGGGGEGGGRQSK
jgi:hypothetical protein